MNYNIELAYAAGYIDGDGCLYIGRTEGKKSIVYEYSVQVSSVNPDIINWFKQRFGGAIRAKERIKNHKQPHVWTIKNRECIDLVKDIQPFLIAKHRESHYFMELALHIVDNNFQPLTKDAIEHREIVIANKRKLAALDTIERNMVTEEWKNNIIPLPDPIKATDFAYLAGLIDAEGCFRIKHYTRKNRPNKVYNTCLEIGNTNKNFFSWLLEHFGGSVYFVESRECNKKHSATWIIQAKALSKILPEVIPYLKHKRPMAEKLMNFLNSTLSNGGDRHSIRSKEAYAAILQQREALVQDIHILNAKGHKDS